MQELAALVAEVTARDGGASVDVAAGCVLEPVDAWYLPRYPDRTRIVPPDEDLAAAIAAFMAAQAQSLTEPDLWMGSWIDPASGACYLDLVTRVATAECAVELARHYSARYGRRVLAVCNPARKSTAPVF